MTVHATTPTLSPAPHNGAARSPESSAPTLGTGLARFMAALRHDRGDATPVWFMRQAGRSLASYRALRRRHGFLELCKTPELAAEVTLLPVAELGVDAAVIFADIMLPVEPMGLELEMREGVGPVIGNPVRTLDDVERLRPVEPEADLSFVLDAIRLTRRELEGKTAVLGFAGAPFTLACYLIEGRPSRDYARAKALMYGAPAVWDALMGRLAAVTADYLLAQARAGADAVQLFDSWVGALSPIDYARYVKPHVASIFAALKAAGVPSINFGAETGGLLEVMAAAGGDVISVDARVPLDAAWARVGHDRGVQGNLDATRLLGGWTATEEGARDVLRRAAGRPGHIFNLGHGVLPETDPALLKRLVDLVHEETAVPKI